MPNGTNNTTPVPAHKQIRLARRALELSQLEVAIHAGISQSQYSLFEQGYVKLSGDIVRAIQAFLKATQQVGQPRA